MKMHDAPATTVFRKEGHPYTWPVSLVPAKGKRWRYRGPHGWRSKIAATPAEAWALLAAALRTDGWTPAEPVQPRANPKRTHATDVQTLLFDERYFTPKEAKRWAKNHGFRYGKVDEGGPSATFIRLRQHAPDEYRKGTLRTITLDADQTIKAVIGVPLRAAAATRPEGYDSRGPRKNPHKPFKFHEHPRLSFRNATTGEPPTMAEWGEMVTRAHQIIDAWKYRSPEQLEWAARVDPAYYADVVVLGAAYGGPMGKPQ